MPAPRRRAHQHRFGLIVPVVRHQYRIQFQRVHLPCKDGAPALARARASMPGASMPPVRPAFSTCSGTPQLIAQRANKALVLQRSLAPQAMLYVAGLQPKTRL